MSLRKPRNLTKKQKEADDELIHAVMVDYKLKKPQKRSIDDPMRKKLTPHQQHKKTFGGSIYRPKFSQLSTKWSSKNSGSQFSKLKSKRIYGDTRQKNKLFLRQGSEFLFSALGIDSIGYDTDTQSIATNKIPQMKNRPITAKTLNLQRMHLQQDEQGQHGEYFKKRKLNRPMTALGNSHKNQLISNQLGAKKQTQSNKRIRPQSSLNYARKGLKSAKIIKQHIPEEESSDDSSMEKPQIQLKDVSAVNIKKTKDLRIRTRVTKVLRSRIGKRYISKVASQPKNIQHLVPKPNLLEKNMENFIQKKNRNLPGHFVKNKKHCNKEASIDLKKYRRNKQRNLIYQEHGVERRLEEQSPQKFQIKQGNFFNPQVLQKLGSIKSLGNDEEVFNNGNSEIFQGYESNTMKNLDLLQLRNQILIEQKQKKYQEKMKILEEREDLRRLGYQIEDISDEEDHESDLIKDEFEKGGQSQVITFFQNQNLEVKKSSRSGKKSNRSRSQKKSTLRSDRSKSFREKSSRRGNKSKGSEKSVQKTQKQLEEEMGSWKYTRMRLEDNTVAFLNEKIIYFDNEKRFMDEKFGKQLSREDELIEERMKEHDELVKNKRKRFKGPYRYCEIMGLEENIMHKQHLSEPMDPIWSEEVKKRPDSPPMVYQEDQLEDIIDRNKAQALKRSLLTNIEVEFISKQYKMKENGEKFDLKRVDQILKPLFFFIKFTNHIRQKILKNSKLNFYPRGNILFKQGDYGDKMYVILKGSVNVIVNIPDPFTGQITPRVVAWMKDGSSFGEYSMLSGESRGNKMSVFNQIKNLTASIKKREGYLKQGIIYGQDIDLKKNNPILQEFQKKQNEGKKKKLERTKRAADIIIAEDAYLLELSRDFFKEIILMTIKDEYEKKMRLIAEISFLRNHEMMRLMPVVNFFKKRVFKLGQSVLQQGDLINEVIVVAKGRCKVVDISIRSRISKPTHYITGLKPNLRRLKFGNKTLDNHKPPEERADIGFEVVKKMEEQERLQQQREEEKKRNERRKKGEKLYEDTVREFSFIDEPELTKNNPDYVYYRDHAFIKYLERGAIFGLRALKKYTLERTKDGFKTNENYSKYANLSVLAETAQVVVYTFNSENFKYLTEDIKKTFIEAVQNSLDFDEEDVDVIKKFSDHWDQYKNNLFNETMKNQFFLKNKDTYKKY